MNKKIVSANYRNREAKEKWLIRNENEHARYALPSLSIKATGVKFEPSPDHEQGFGCTMVAVCEAAEVFTKLDFKKEGLTPLHFNIWRGFLAEGTEKTVDEVAILYLDENGKMWAQIEATTEVAKAVIIEAAEA